MTLKEAVCRHPIGLALALTALDLAWAGLDLFAFRVFEISDSLSEPVRQALYAMNEAWYWVHWPALELYLHYGGGFVIHEFNDKAMIWQSIKVHVSGVLYFFLVSSFVLVLASEVLQWRSKDGQ